MANKNHCDSQVEQTASDLSDFFKKMDNFPKGGDLFRDTHQPKLESMDEFIARAKANA